MPGPAAPLYDGMLTILSRYGSRTMAKSALDSALGRLNKTRDGLRPGDLEVVSEETMNSFRVFCSEEQRRALWIELVDFIVEAEQR